MNTTVGRVRRLTVEALNKKIRRDMESRVAYFAAHPEQVDSRLRELDEEWDIERTIEIESASMVMVGALLGITTSRRWFVLPVLAGGMLLLHNLHGAYPLLPLFRRMGIRTAREIAAERYALKALRGDFERTDDAATDAEKTQHSFEAAHTV